MECVFVVVVVSFLEDSSYESQQQKWLNTAIWPLVLSDVRTMANDAKWSFVDAAGFSEDDLV